MSGVHNIQPWQSLTAGLIAGGVEGFITCTYISPLCASESSHGKCTDPAELTKTACQFSAKQGIPISPTAVVTSTYKAHGIKGFYSGCSALVAGNSLKAGVRFLSYDAIKNALRDPMVCLSKTERVVILKNGFDCSLESFQQRVVSLLVLLLAQRRLSSQ